MHLSVGHTHTHTHLHYKYYKDNVRLSPELFIHFIAPSLLPLSFCVFIYCSVTLSNTHTHTQNSNRQETRVKNSFKNSINGRGNLNPCLTGRKVCEKYKQTRKCWTSHTIPPPPNPSLSPPDSPTLTPINAIVVEVS